MHVFRMALLIGVGFAGHMSSGTAADAQRSLAPPAVDSAAASDGETRTAVLSGGCFWGMQGLFEHVKGVTRVVAGYAGGSRLTARYEIVATGKTTHAESVKITFDPRAVSYGRLLQIYFSVAHDPTELDRQGPDSGSQYRSEIWYVDDMQKHIAEAYIAQLTAAHAFPAPIATRVEAYGGFFRAEDEHQDYLIRNLDQRYIADFDLPRIAALKRLYPDSYTETPVLIR